MKIAYSIGRKRGMTRSVLERAATGTDGGSARPMIGLIGEAA